MIQCEGCYFQDKKENVCCHENPFFDIDDNCTDYVENEFVKKVRADALEQHNWISVNDKMPSDCNEDWVLVLPYDGDYRCIPTVAEYRSGHWYGHTLCVEDDCIDGEDSPFEVRFWKPIYDEFQLKEQK